MLIKVIPIVLAATVFLGGCSDAVETSPSPGYEQRAATALDRYPAYSAQSVQLPDGYHGLVKVTTSLEFSNPDGDTGDLVVQGAGCLVVLDGQWHVFTARHVVMPTRDLVTSASMDLGEVERMASTIAVTYLGLVPSHVTYCEEADIADLAIRQEDTGALRAALSQDPGAPLSLPRAAGHRSLVGVEVETWGFPVAQHPQLQLARVSAQPDGLFFILNRGVPAGFSGAPVIYPEDGERRLLGVVIRSDDAAQQSTAIQLGTALELLRRQDATAVTVPGEVRYDGVPVALRVRP